MKRTQEVKDRQTALGYKKEYDMFVRNANLPGIAKIEQDYFMNMANRTVRMINWGALEKKKKVERQDEFERYDRSERRVNKYN